MKKLLTRRSFIVGSTIGAGLSLSGCDVLTGSDSFSRVLKLGETITMGAQRLFLSDKALAREFTEADMSPVFKSNGTHRPDSAEYAALAENNFVDWRLVIDGLVDQPLSLSLAELKRLPSRTQITRHDCVEGWSAIGKWTGVPLGLLLQAARLKPNARYLVFHCADEYEKTLDGTGQYYESIDLVDAFHPQTILAYGMNGTDLPIPNGAPLRLRVERQLGYKHAKYLMRIEAVESFAAFGRGNGGFWEDRGYEWYAGI
ncbi:molybdopterin-binding protein [Kaistia dalseonensis]|uniref:DMSO/TMAO reductase YedYZ molybdopterin-dependent catalytic subunit n=1 Tax=Kaistia dalseonensis TaxID=410840 RepID=A0ABU0H5R3_9HYPH|nr:molybdopterin-binding protein [Kaistia dalseonensis]MCX5495043.1 molybdopterin-binding protein [Kaistia dalseonensis]MDQ0437625.1 DMSO/TMAO reductase YedYZ molybdopterin-dependent catalytic subunit [Kaistia dalseonensis]